jgi:hypothetical protein
MSKVRDAGRKYPDLISLVFHLTGIPLLNRPFEIVVVVVVATATAFSEHLGSIFPFLAATTLRPSHG